jgi:hypothetical protein
MKTKQQRVNIPILAAALALFFPALQTFADEQGKVHRVKLNRDALEHARKLIDNRGVVVDGRGAWARHQPSAADENEFIRRFGFEEYGKWHLGIDERHAKNTKARYKFPYGDFRSIHRCALLAARSRARQHGYADIENATASLIEMFPK